MPHRRVLSLWFPRLAAERALRLERGLTDRPLAIVARRGNMQTIVSVSAEAAAQGLRCGQSLQDARAICADLMTRPEDPQGQRAFLVALRRWAGKFSPWVAEEGAAGLVLDLTGCAHLFGGEAALVAQAEQDCADHGLSVRLGLADTPGAAWALARFAGVSAGSVRTGDAIDQEARATRSRAVKRRNWERGGPAPAVQKPGITATARIAPEGQLHQVLAPLPITALRLTREEAEGLGKVGLRTIGDLVGQPRGAIARRYGRGVVRRLDQALGVEPEPISPARPPNHFALRLSFPDPIGLEDDILAGLDRLLTPLCEKLRDKGRGARRLRLELHRAGGGATSLEIGLARPGHDPAQIRLLFGMKLGEVDAGFGFDMLRLEAHVTEPVYAQQHKGGRTVSQEITQERAHPDKSDVIAGLIERLGTRIGLEQITRVHPADSNIPEKTHTVHGAAWVSAHDGPWPAAPTPRPLVMFRPEPVTCSDPAQGPLLPSTFRWRGRHWTVAQGLGPERIAPEWWLDDPNWRSGQRDYWRVDTTDGARLWLFFAHGGGMSAGWFAQGNFG